MERPLKNTGMMNEITACAGMTHNSQLNIQNLALNTST